jgi:hypothetical protein
MRAAGLVLLAACAAPAAQPQFDDLEDDGGKADSVASRLPVEFEDGKVIVQTDTASSSEARAIALLAEDAWQFDLASLRWSDPPALDAEPLTVLALSSSELSSRFHGIAAGAMGRTTVVVNAEEILNEPGVMAHELSHVQMTRMGGGLPHTLEEGKAVVLQRMYLHAQGVPYPSGHDAASYYETVTPAVADQAISEFMFGGESGGDVNRDERTGALVVEYLRVKAPVPFVDMLPQLADCVEVMSETPATGPAQRLARFQQAFVIEFGITFASVRSGLGSFLSNEHGAARISDTVLTSQY